jgi:hypothetical protein
MINVIFVLVKHDVMGTKIAPSFLIHHGKAIFLVAMHPVFHFLSFQHFKSTLIHQGRLSRKRIVEKGSDLMEKSLRRMEIMNGPQDHEGTFHTRTAYLPEKKTLA